MRRGLRLLITLAFVTLPLLAADRPAGTPDGQKRLRRPSHESGVAPKRTPQKMKAACVDENGEEVPCNDDPGTGGGGGGSCSYCTQYKCGCDAPPPGYRLSSWDCACGSATCTRTCTYVAL
jgi:hypothetical protein